MIFIFKFKFKKENQNLKVMLVNLAQMKVMVFRTVL